MNKVALISPANISQMPYIENYMKVLKKNNIEYDIINWDRTQTEVISKNTFIDKKNSYQRNFLDYLMYSIFIIKKLKNQKYEFLIIFSPHLVFFLQFFLLRSKHKFIIDIRDYHSIIKFLLPEIINKSEFIVVSSPGYKKFFSHEEIYVNHNFNRNLEEFKNNLDTFTYNKNESPITISLIGSMRDLEINKKFIMNCNNNKKMNIVFNGEGGQEKLLKEFVDKNNFKNVKFTGRYKKINEDSLYKSSNIINVMRYNDSLNNNFALTNRLYNAVFNLKPLITMDGTYQSEIIKKYDLGLIISDFEDISLKIEKYLDSFDEQIFLINCKSFLERVIQENTIFEKAIVSEINKVFQRNKME